jgi:hypothetical protein
MPAAFYRHLGLDETGTFQNKPLQKLTRSRLARVPGQTKKHLLCGDCEKLFNKNGESWVSRFAHQVGRGFRLQRALLSRPPRTRLRSGRIYCADDNPEIDWSKLAYFALSVFWRGAVDSWITVDDRAAKPFIDIEATLRERLRGFLLGEEYFPEGILLTVKVSASLSPAAHMMSFPSNGTIEMPGGQRPQCTFIVPGMIFTLITGGDLRDEWLHSSCLIRGRGHPIFMLDTDDLFYREAMSLVRTAKPSQKTIDEVRELWRKTV